MECVSFGGDGAHAKRKLPDCDEPRRHYDFALDASSPLGAAAAAAATLGGGGSGGSPASLAGSPHHALLLPPVDAKVRRRGSSVVASDPCLMKRCHSEGKIASSLATGEMLPSVAFSSPAAHAPMLPLHVKKSGVVNSPRRDAYHHASSSPVLFGGHCTPPRPNRMQHEDPKKEFKQSLSWDRASSGTRSPTSTSPRFMRGSVDRLASPQKKIKNGTGGFSSGSPVLLTPPTPSPLMNNSKRSLNIDLNLESRSSVPTTAATCMRSSSLPKRSWQPPRKNRNPGNLSLDLSQMDTQSALDPSGEAPFQRRVDHAAVCSQLTDFLYVGGAVAAKDKTMLLRLGITHVINCAANVAPAFFPDEFRYYNIRLRDHSTQDIARHFYNIFDFIETARQSGGRIFVHCIKGISRSPTMVIAYLMWYKRMGMYKALDFVRQARPVVDPNAGFIFQLTEWEHLHLEGKLKFQRPVVFRIELPRESSASSINRPLEPQQQQPQMEPQQLSKTSPVPLCQEPLIIGPLTALGRDYFQNPSKEIVELCFIVACAEYVCIWCGSEAQDQQIQAAQHATMLLQRFEAFPEQCELARQGQESGSFWQLVDSLRPDQT